MDFSIGILMFKSLVSKILQNGKSYFANGIIPFSKNKNVFIFIQ